MSIPGRGAGGWGLGVCRGAGGGGGRGPDITGTGEMLQRVTKAGGENHRGDIH